MNEIKNETPEEREEGVSSIRHWVEDNLRLIISVVIVIALGVTIYSYSQRTKESTVVFDNEQNTQEQVLVDDQDVDQPSQQPTEDVQNEQVQNEEPKQEDVSPQTTSAETSKETDSAIVAIAVKGDGLTHLSRKALQDYLAKNPNSELTAAHKIYIEDALRKAVGYQGGVHVGTEVSFSKDLIQKTIEQSRNLNDRQLKNIQTKYVPLVPSLR